VQLTEEQEELCTYWSQTIGTPWQEKERYRTNFETLMNSKFPNFELDKADFTLIRAHLDE
jgi:DNA topoisomerase-1